MIVPTELLPLAMPSTDQEAAPPPGTVAVSCWVRPRVIADIRGDRLMVALETVSVADAGALIPPGPLHMSVYEMELLIAPVPWVPLTAREPLQPPEALQEVALVELQVSVELAPGAITEGLTESVAVGSGRMATDALAGAELPPAPVHSIV